MNKEMKLLKKAHLMYLLEDNLPDLVMEVSLKTKYKDLSREELYKESLEVGEANEWLYFCDRSSCACNSFYFYDHSAAL